MAITLANAAKATPDRGDTHRSKYRSPCGLVKDLEAFVDDLDVLRSAHLTVRVGRRAVAPNTWEGDAVKVQSCIRYTWCYKGHYGSCAVLNDHIRPIFMEVGNFWIFCSLALLTLS